MLIYSTRFRVVPEFGKKEFVKNITDWNKSGKYHIDDIEENSFSFIAGDDDKCLEVTDLESECIIAARMHVKTDGGIWNTDFILNYGLGVLSVYVNKTVEENTANMSAKAFVPTFVKQIISRGFAGKSTGFAITDAPISAPDRETLMNAVNMPDRYSLPFVYLSSRAEISAEKLAEKLTGLAVTVKDGSDLLKDDFPEPIYIFFPHRNVEPVSFGEFPFHRNIQRKIFDYLNGREYNRLETWDGVQNERANRSNIEILKKYKAASEDNDALAEMYTELENELKADAQLKEKLSFENSRLTVENARLMQENERLRENGVPLVMRGNEEDMYADEQREIIMEILKEYLRKNVGENTRRADILKAVIEANPAEGTPEKYRNMIKKSLDGYKAFETADITKTLKKTGIEIIEHTGHYKIALGGDHRYVCEAAATCSDSRGGLNLVSEINKKMF